MIPEAFIQELLNRVDIVDVVDRNVPLKKAGANYSACCPFHNEKSPSFTVSPTKQFYHCFGCGAHGTAIGFLMEHQGLSFVEAVQELAKMVGLIVPQETRDPDRPSQKVTPGLQVVLQQASNYYRSELKKSPRAIEYLKARGLTGEVAARFQMGYAPSGWQNLEAVFDDYQAEALQVAGLVVENEQGKRYDRFRDRIVFPIHDQKGQVIGFGGRILPNEKPDQETARVFPSGSAAEAARSDVKDTPKYYNSPETPLFQKGHELYGLFLARRAIRDAGRALVVEGYMDVVALAQYGIEYAVAALGTATTPFHITKLMRQTDEIVFCFDGDTAGLNAAWRAAMNALPALTDSLRLSFLFLPKEHDPDSYVREFGKEKFEAELKAATPLSNYIINHLSANINFNSDEDSGRFWEEVKPILTQIKAPILAHGLRERVAEFAGIKTDEIEELIGAPKQKVQRPKSLPHNPRIPLSLKRKFACLMILRPDLASQSDLDLFQGLGNEDVLIRKLLEIILLYPASNPAAILHLLKGKVDAHLLNEIEHKVHLLDDGLDFALELEGQRKHMREMYLQRSHSALLGGKSLSELTEVERQQLKSMSNSAAAKKR